MYLIKNFGDNEYCETLDQVKNALARRYSGLSVTVLEKKPSGISVPHFVDVSKQGQVTASYGELTLFN